MNCDEAFEALTDPDSRDNSALHWHLEFCPRCREMQNVLAPALNLLTSSDDDMQPAFQDDCAASRVNRLPQIKVDNARPRTARRRRVPFLTPDAVQVAEQSARMLHRARTASHHRLWRKIAACAMIVLASLGIVSVMNSSVETPSNRSSSPIMLADHCLWTNRGVEETQTQDTKQSEHWVVLSCVACHLE